MTELEKAVEKATWSIEEPPCGAYYCCCSDDKFENVFKQGVAFMTKPEHMKLTPEVKGLVEAAKMTVSAYHMCGVTDDKDAMVLNAAGLMSEEALKPFEKEGAE